MIRVEFEAALLDVLSCGAERSLMPTTLPSSLEVLLAAVDDDECTLLYKEAAVARDRYCGQRMVLRGLVEFSSYCSNTCLYCGLNRYNSALARYRMSVDEILESVRSIRAAGIGTVVLQSGEDSASAAFIENLIHRIRAETDMAITLSVGERPREEYRCWKEAGADRYLLRVESSDAWLYASLHRGRELVSRLRCLRDLRELGYQVGSGIMVGPPGQTIAHIAQDILFFREHDFDMIGLGPFIPHPQTPFATAATPSLELSLNTLALTRLLCGGAWLPATTALASLDRDYRLDALNAGANVVMPNFTPSVHKKQYEIYPGKRCIKEHANACIDSMARLAYSSGLKLDLSRADSLKPVNVSD